MTDHTRTILEKAATIAVVGLSTNETKAAYAVPAFLQQGIRSAEARRIAEDGGLQYVEARCMGKLVAYYGITITRQVALT